MAVERIWMLPAPAGTLTEAALTLILIGYGGIALARPTPDIWVVQHSVSGVWKEQGTASDTWKEQTSASDSWVKQI